MSHPSTEQQVFRDWSDTREIEPHMSNFDHEIDDGMEEGLRADPKAFSRHAGWNFNGRVWFENGIFHEEVWVYRVPQKIVSAPSLRELMSAVNEEFGHE